MSTPSVLVVMPTLGGRPDTLGPALRSVQMQQDVQVRLVVVVPPEATDAVRTAREHGAVVVDDPRRGLSAAVNEGIAARRGEEFYAWLGDDDQLEPGGLSLLADMLQRDPGAVVAYGACPYIDDAGRTIGVSRAGDWAARILAWGPDLVPQPASLTRLDAMLAVGPYDESLKFAMDLDMFLRLRPRGRFVSTTQSTASFRWHADSLTVANRSLSLAESEAVKHRHLRPGLRRIAPLWDVPVRGATHLAAKRVSARARRLAAHGDTRA